MNDNPKTPTQEQLLDYEIRASVWAPWIRIRWMQDLAGRYFAWKVRRKYSRWQASRAERSRVNERSRKT